MKNLSPYNGNSFCIHQQAVKNKHASKSKDKIIYLTPLIKTQYDVFESHVHSNTLLSVTSNPVIGYSKTDLLTLYNYNSTTIREVRENIRLQQINTIISTCQNCTINSANTLDHILPKSAFPEFIVNPLNLFPCCTTCNSFKLNSTHGPSGPKFLNLYLDELPEIQYLFIQIFLDENEQLDFSFYLENIENKIPNDFFTLITNHYHNLKLLERFKLKSIEFISELESRISAFKKNLQLEDIVEVYTESIEIEKKAYGFNHWKYILESTLINSELFIRKFK